MTKAEESAKANSAKSSEDLFNEQAHPTQDAKESQVPFDRAAYLERIRRAILAGTENALKREKARRGFKRRRQRRPSKGGGS